MSRVRSGYPSLHRLAALCLGLLVALPACGGDENAGEIGIFAGGGGGCVGAACDATASGGDGGGGADTTGGGGDGGGGGTDASTDAGAGSGGAVIDAEPTPQPALEARLDGQVTAVQSFWINPNPQADNSKLKIKIELENKGEVPLRIDALEWASETPQIALDWYDTPLGPGDYPYELQPFQTLTLSAVWTTEPKLADQAIATLTVYSNDPKQPTVVLTVATPCTDAKLVLGDATLTIKNAGPYNGKVACTTIGNIGCQVLTLQSVALQPVDPRFKLVEPPAAGTPIGIYGSGDNPKDAPALLPVCVRFEPTDDKQQPASTTLVVYAQGQSAQKKTAEVKTAWSPLSTYTLACGGKQVFDLGAGPPGGTASCKLQNHGPAPLEIATLALAPGNAAAQQSAIDAAFGVHIAQGGAQQAPWTLPGGSVAELVVTWKADADPPPATLRVGLRHDAEHDELALPVMAGPCNEPSLRFGPAPPTFLATPGQSATGTITLANQSCAPLHITHGCLTSYQVSQDNACETGAPSTEYALVSGALSQTLPPFGTAALTLQWKPLAPLGKPHYGQLHLYWCRGVWDGSACSGKVEKLSIQLEGNSSAGVVPPEAALAAKGPAQVGKTVWLAGSITPGNHPIGDFGAFQWTITQRPAGSAAWFEADITDGALRGFAPDLPGQYTVALRVAAFTPGELTTQSNSAPATLTLTVP